MKFRTRQLSNGKWIAEVHSFFWWCAIYIVYDRYIRKSSRGDFDYANSFHNSEEEARNTIVKYKSLKGL